MDLCGHFEYAGVTSRKYGMVFANVETSRMANLSGSVNVSTIFNKSNKRNYLIDDDYSEFRLSFEVDIITDDERAIELKTRREIERWLFNHHGYRRLYMDLTDDAYGEMHEFVDGVQKRLYMNCRFLNPQKLEYNGGIVGYRCTLEADSGLLWQDAVSKTFLFEGGKGGVIEIDVDTDLVDYTYPEVTIKMGDAGDVLIINNTDDSTRMTKFSGLSKNTQLTMNGEVNYITKPYYDKFSQRNFIRLLSGTNTLTISGNVSSITFEFQNRRYL